MGLSPFPDRRIARIMQKRTVLMSPVQASCHLERSGPVPAVEIGVEHVCKCVSVCANVCIYYWVVHAQYVVCSYSCVISLSVHKCADARFAFFASSIQ